jgi:hypothetical protein
MLYHCLSVPEFITKLIIVTNTFLACIRGGPSWLLHRDHSDFVFLNWMDSNSFKDFSKTVCSFELLPFSTLFGLRLDIWVLLLSVVFFHCLLPEGQLIGWLGDLLLSFVSTHMSSHTLCLLGVLRMGKFLILGYMYPRSLSAPEVNARLRTFPNNSLLFQKPIISMIHELIDFLLFLIIGHRSLFALSLPLQLVF